MNVYKFELKMYVQSIVAWSISLFLLIFSFMIFYPTFGSDMAMMDKIMENYPEALLKAMGMSGGLSMATVLGYLVFVFAFIQLCLAIQAANYGFSLLSVEERELTADFLMSKPISRNRILLSKILAAITALFITNIVLWFGTFLSVELFRDGKEYDLGLLIMFLSTSLMFQLFFLSVGMLISVSVDKVRSVLSFSMAMSFGLYILNALRSIFGGELLGVVTPFYHFEAGYIFEKGHFNYIMVFLSVAVIVVSFIGSYLLYLKRNIHSL